MITDEMVKDPVCGMVKLKSQMKAVSEYKGEKYYFCSEQDREIFEAHPEHWVGRK